MEIKNEMLVDLSTSSDTLKINFDITLYKYPCALVCIDTADGMGSHSMNLEDGIQKTVINEKGEIVPNKTNIKTQGLNRDAIFQMAQEEYKNKEGCRVNGTFTVLRVPGNFHISAHGFRDIVQRLATSNGFKFDFSHRINHLSFGETVLFNDIHKDFNVGIFHPLDKRTKMDNEKNNIFEYYLQITPSEFVKENQTLQLFQFIVNEFTDNDYSNFPAIFFRLKISPILVKYSLIKPNTFNGVINIFAIFGGLFTIAGILDSFLLRLFSRKKNVVKPAPPSSPSSAPLTNNKKT